MQSSVGSLHPTARCDIISAMLYICEKALWFTSSDSSSSKWLENFPIFLSQACNIMFLASRLNTRISALTNLFGYAFWVQGRSFMDCMFNCLQDIHRLNVVLYFVAIQQSINHRAILFFFLAMLHLCCCCLWPGFFAKYIKVLRGVLEIESAEFWFHCQ